MTPKSVLVLKLRALSSRWHKKEETESFIEKTEQRTESGEAKETRIGETEYWRMNYAEKSSGYLTEDSLRLFLNTKSCLHRVKLCKVRQKTMKSYKLKNS